MRRELHQTLEQTGGAQVPFGFKRGHGQSLRVKSGPEASDFPEPLAAEPKR